MKIHWLIAGLCSVAMTTSFAWAQEAAPGTVQLEDLERQIGPLEVMGQRFTIVLQKKRIVGAAADTEFGETVSRMEIRDQGGEVVYEREFAYEFFGDRFLETWDVSARVLKGNQASGLLITYGVSPSTPLGGESWQVLGIVDGKLAPWGYPLYTEGQLINGEKAEPGEPVETSQEPGLNYEVLHFRVWTGNFFVIVPVRVNWFDGQVRAGWNCVKMTLRGPEPVCQVRVETERVPQESETFVLLYPEPEPMGAEPEEVVVSENSKVEFLAAEANLIWDQDVEGVGLAVGEDIWLKVRIDGQEGWIHTQEDFYAIGLPQAG